MAKYEVCEHCKGWVNTESTPHEVIQHHNGREVFVHYYSCSRLYREKENGNIKSYHRGDHWFA
jgi:hypothetical protein